MDKIIIHIRPVEWTEGERYGLQIRVSGENPEVRIDWGDGSVKSFYGNEIEEYHTYPKNKFLQFKVKVAVISGKVEFIDPCGGECDIDVIDFSNAPSIKEISVENCQNITLDNPNLEKLSVRIFNGRDIDLSKCPNLRQLSFEGGIDMTEIDLSGCHRLERLDVDGSWQNPDFSKIVIANDAHLKYVRLSSVNLSKGSVQFIQNLIHRNKGEIYYA